MVTEERSDMPRPSREELGERIGEYAIGVAIYGFYRFAALVHETLGPLFEEEPDEHVAIRRNEYE